ncbi:MAG: AraC family transcriptional regulator ligand-binding domain-containing protein [Myxococcota bacterium]
MLDKEYGIIRPRFVRLLATTLERRLGHLPEAFDDNLPSGWRNDDTLAISKAQMIQAWEIAAKALPAEPFGLYVAQMASASLFGLLGYLAQYSATVEEACLQVVHYNTVLKVDAGHWEIQRSPIELVIRYHVHLPGIRAWRHKVDFIIGSFVLICRAIAGRPHPDLRVDVGHAPVGDPAIYREILGPRVGFSASTPEIALDPITARRSLPGSRPGLLAILKDVADQQRRVEPKNWSDRVRRVLLGGIPDGITTVTEVAPVLGVSARSLRRRLLEEDTSFRALLDQSRFELARRLLEDPALSTDQIANVLGFCTVTAFYRAFPRWAGTSLADYRHELTAQGRVFESS